MTARPRKPFAVVLRALGLGDLLTGIPALRALRRALPAHRIVLCAPAVLGPLAACTGAVNDLSPTGPLEPVEEALAKADVAVNLHGRGPESSTILAATRPQRLIAFDHPAVPRTRGQPPWIPGEHEVARWCRLLDRNGMPADPRDLRLEIPPGPVPEPVPGATLVHPGAASAARRWPPERWAEVVRGERARGRRVVVTGGPTEISLAHHVAELAGLDPSCVLAGRTDLVNLARVVAAAGRVVVGDTGVAHLATALGTPSVVLFGPTSPAEWGPPPDRPEHRVLWAGRTGDPHSTAPDGGLLDVQPDVVLAQLATTGVPFYPPGSRVPLSTRSGRPA